MAIDLCHYDIPKLCDQVNVVGVVRGIEEGHHREPLKVARWGVSSNNYLKKDGDSVYEIHVLH